jgi:hypothetical protein
MTKLDAMSNSFDEVNRVRCFNHTLQLSAKTLLKPFNVGFSSNKAGDKQTSDGNEDSDGDSDGLLVEEDLDDDKEGMGDDECGLNDDIEDDVDELGELDEDRLTKLMEETAAVHAVVSKVSLTPR